MFHEEMVCFNERFKKNIETYINSAKEGSSPVIHRYFVDELLPEIMKYLEICKNQSERDFFNRILAMIDQKFLENKLLKEYLTEEFLKSKGLIDD